jgi:hypothetical protein
MAYLYCSEDGARITDSMVPYEGELTVVTHGPLRMEDCQCDSCNRPIAVGETAYLAEFTHRKRFQSQANVFFNEGEARVRVIAPEGANPEVLMIHHPRREWVSPEEWSKPRTPSFVENLKAAIHRERESRELEGSEIERDR